MGKPEGTEAEPEGTGDMKLKEKRDQELTDLPFIQLNEGDGKEKCENARRKMNLVESLIIQDFVGSCKMYTFYTHWKDRLSYWDHAALPCKN